MINDALAALGVTNPVLAAPMSGGPSTPEMVVAAARAGSLGFLAGGYKTAESLASQIRQVRQSTSAYGVNLFAPNPVPVDRDAYRAYAAAIQMEAEPYGLDVRDSAVVEDDDAWDDKIDLLRADPAPMVSFTFGLPDRAIIASLRQAGSLVAQTVTSVPEARRAAEAGVDLLVVQSAEAGGHSGTLTPAAPPAPVPLPDLVRQVGAAVGLPLVAAGGVGTPADVAAALGAGATAVAVGTALLRTHESGASAPYQAALAETSLATVVTRAFTGRPARAIPNLFVERYDALAPSGYPAVHHLTIPLRRAAAAAGDAERINLWAGVGYRSARIESTADTLSRLAGPV